MCEYCGCQQIAAIGELTREHDAVVAEIAVARTAVRGADTEAAARAARRIAAVLAPHTVVEEEGLFPLMAQDFPGHVDALQAEHRRVEAVLDEASRGTPTAPDWPARLLEALELLREHILKEQDGMFPAALTTLDADGWEQVDRARSRAGAAPLPELVGAALPARQWASGHDGAEPHHHDHGHHDHPHHDHGHH